MDVIEVIARGLTGAGFMGVPHPLHSPSAPCMHCIALHCRSCRGRSAMRRSPKRRTRGRGSGPNRAREPEAKSQRRPLKFPSRYALPAEKIKLHQFILFFCVYCFVCSVFIGGLLAVRHGVGRLHALAGLRAAACCLYPPACVWLASHCMFRLPGCNAWLY